MVYCQGIVKAAALDQIIALAKVNCMEGISTALAFESLSLLISRCQKYFIVCYFGILAPINSAAESMPLVELV